MASKPPPLTDDQFVEEVRGYIRDFPELNRIIRGAETSNRMMKYCIVLALDEWNTTPPLCSSGATFLIVKRLTSPCSLGSKNTVAMDWVAVRSRRREAEKN